MVVGKLPRIAITGALARDKTVGEAAVGLGGWWNLRARDVEWVKDVENCAV